MAIERDGIHGRMQFVTVPDGAMIEIVGEPQQSGLIDVRFEGRVIAMFLRDIEGFAQRRGDRGNSQIHSRYLWPQRRRDRTEKHASRG